MIMKVAHPKMVYFELTRLCNLACMHCLNSSGSRIRGELCSSEVFETIDKLAAFGILEIRFTGGEPTVHPDLKDAIALATKHGIKTSIGTNAVMIHKELAARLYRAGLRKAIVSLDGDEPTNDALRGIGSFKRSWQGVCALHASGIDVRINAVAMKTTLSGLPFLAKLCAEKGIRLFIRRYVPCGRTMGNLSEFLTSMDYEHLRMTLSAFIEQGVVDGHSFSAHKHNVCSAGTSGFVVLPNGDVKSCGFLSELGENAYGNVRSETLSTIWKRIISSRFLAKSKASLETWSNSRPDLPRTNCPAIAICGSATLVQFQGKSP